MCVEMCDATFWPLRYVCVITCQKRMHACAPKLPTKVSFDTWYGCVCNARIFYLLGVRLLWRTHHAYLCTKHVSNAVSGYPGWVFKHAVQFVAL